jgi:hypothetical protein
MILVGVAAEADGAVRNNAARTATSTVLSIEWGFMGHLPSETMVLLLPHAATPRVRRTVGDGVSRRRPGGGSAEIGRPLIGEVEHRCGLGLLGAPASGIRSGFHAIRSGRAAHNWA